jgi:hypothetical protein
LKLVKDKEAFLLSELTKDIKDMSEEFGLEEPPTNKIKTHIPAEENVKLATWGKDRYMQNR